MKKLITATLLASLMAGSALADTKLKLVEVITSPERTETLKSIVAKFEAANPGTTVEIISLPWGEAFQKFATMVSAGELPDVVAHSVTMMVLQAAGARQIARVDLARSEEAMARVERLGALAVDELRHILGLLGAEDGRAHPSAPAAPGLSRLEDLVAGVRAGISVAVEEHGTPRQLHPGAGATVYRVVQEALTNALRHARPGARARVTLAWSPDDLLVEIVDQGDGASAGAPARRTRSRRTDSAHPRADSGRACENRLGEAPRAAVDRTPVRGADPVRDQPPGVPESRQPGFATTPCRPTPLGAAAHQSPRQQECFGMAAP